MIHIALHLVVTKSEGAVFYIFNVVNRVNMLGVFFEFSIFPYEVCVMW